MGESVKDWEQLTDRQRDRLVHVHVLGKPEACGGELVHDGGQTFLICEACHKAVPVSAIAGVITIQGHICETIPHYSTMLSAAWMVLEHLNFLAAWSDHYLSRKRYRSFEARMALEVKDWWKFEADFLSETICRIAVEVYQPDVLGGA